MNKHFLLILFSLTAYTTAVAQKKPVKPEPDSVAYYMNNDYDVASGEQDAKFLRLVIKADSGMYRVEDYYMDAKPRLLAKSSINLADFTAGAQGPCVQYFNNGNKKSETYYDKGLLKGDGIEYYPNGNLYNIKNYDNPDHVLLMKFQDSTGHVLADNGNGTWMEFNDRFERVISKGTIKGSREDGEWEMLSDNGSMQTIVYKNGIEAVGQKFTDNRDRVYLEVGQKPSYPGGKAALEKYLYKNLNYPIIAKDNKIQGKVLIGFVIEKDGTLSDFKVLRTPDESLSKEAIRVLSKCPAWKPGIEHGRYVRVQQGFPVEFSL